MVIFLTNKNKKYHNCIAYCLFHIGHHRNCFDQNILVVKKVDHHNQEGLSQCFQPFLSRGTLNRLFYRDLQHDTRLESFRIV